MYATILTEWLTESTSISIDEAVEVIWNGFEVRRNKRYHGGYQILGRTDGGRNLKLIVHEKRKGLIRDYWVGFMKAVKKISETEIKRERSLPCHKPSLRHYLESQCGRCRTGSKVVVNQAPQRKP